MSKQGRIGLVVATLVVLVVAFVVLSPGGDDESDRADTTTAPVAPVAPPATGTTDGTPTTPAPPPPPPPAPTFETIRVKASQPVGGIQTITFNKGDRARIQVSSTDTSDEIHVHGFDKYGNVAPGRPARISFEANAEGIFEIELHGSGTQIGKLVVEP